MPTSVGGSTIILAASSACDSSPSSINVAITIDWQFWHDFFHDGLLVAGFNGWSRLLRDPIDLGVVDGSFNSLAEGVRGSAQRLRRVQTGYVRNYALAIALGVVGIVAYLVLRRVF